MDHPEHRAPSPGTPGPGPHTGPPTPSRPEVPAETQLNRELIDHRLNQLEEGVKATNESVNGLRDAINTLNTKVEKIDTGMATKTHVFVTALALVGTLIAGIILKSL